MRRISVIAAAVMSVALASCGGDDNNNPTTQGSTEKPQASTPPTKNVVFFLGDGMGMTTMTAARIYKVGEDGDLTMDTLPESGFVRTYSNNAQVTDSAPSMAAYMTGVKMNNEVISMTPETSAFDANGKDYLSGADSTCPSSGNGKSVPTLLEQMKAAGYGTGVVTTTRITHATPAATYAHICHRDGENTIAAQLVPKGAGFNGALGDGVDVVFGGGRKHFQNKAAGGARTDNRDLVAEFKAAGYTYAANKSDFDKIGSSAAKVVGLFNSSHMAYDLDRDPAAEPSLAEMTGKAIDVLAAKKKGFFLMVEGGRIDHALHETTARKALQDTVAFDNAIKAAIDKLNVIDPGLKNTLIVVTADHDHTLVLNGYAKRTGPTTDSNPGVLGLVKNYVTGIANPDSSGNPFSIIGFGNGENRPATRTALTDAAVFDKAYHQEAVIPMATGGETHGGTDVFIGAMGNGAASFSGVMDNTDVFGLIKKTIGL
ncbi:alkaline phosphatase [Cupriavidus sp. USMAA2-4]|uniref:alkaline phosphatase n=1 Tax=unclassified Cupriavidus TaxID=2640874 RepID=UPI0008A6E414|nr:MULTISPECIES: alkaline phosphatase [unclassified Cupriavidus]AOY91969.1 alkaline phosphatase [Cupriavidus sp. USMAA2-4]AOY98472.1 alkaline phosphatase [Cupriavidus sp. USMAHM13]